MDKEAKLSCYLFHRKHLVRVLWAPGVAWTECRKCNPKQTKIILTDQEKERFAQFLIENVDDGTLAPSGGEDNEATLYNLVHLVKGDGKLYPRYGEDNAEQRKEIESYGYWDREE